MGGVKGTKYLLKIRNHAPPKAKNSVPPLFFEKVGDNKKIIMWAGPLAVSHRNKGFFIKAIFGQIKVFQENICTK